MQCPYNMKLYQMPICTGTPITILNEISISINISHHETSLPISLQAGIFGVQTKKIN